MKPTFVKNGATDIHDIKRGEETARYIKEEAQKC